MATSIAKSHTFVVRIWLEESTEEAGRATWRGQITHLTSGERSYLQTLDAISTCMAKYVRQMGAPLPRRRRIWGWAARLLRRPEA
jgi:hypothetical protein